MQTKSDEVGLRQSFDQHTIERLQMQFKRRTTIKVDIQRCRVIETIEAEARIQRGTRGLVGWREKNFL